MSFTIAMQTKSWLCKYTVKRVDEVVRHPHLVTQDQFTQVSKKISDIPAEDFTINIELFLKTFTNVELVRQNWIFSKATSPGRNLDFQIYFPMLYHCATLSSLFNSTLRDRQDAADLYSLSLLYINTVTVHPCGNLTRKSESAWVNQIEKKSISECMVV